MTSKRDLIVLDSYICAKC